MINVDNELYCVVNFADVPKCQKYSDPVLWRKITGACIRWCTGA